jgi:hypothetical protein
MLRPAGPELTPVPRRCLAAAPFSYLRMETRRRLITKSIKIRLIISFWFYKTFLIIVLENGGLTRVAIGKTFKDFAPLGSVHLSSDSSQPPTPSDADLVAQKILAALRGLRFGSVEITVHEGRVVQVERKEKERLNLMCPDGREPGSNGRR